MSDRVLKQICHLGLSKKIDQILYSKLETPLWVRMMTPREESLSPLVGEEAERTLKRLKEEREGLEEFNRTDGYSNRLANWIGLMEYTHLLVMKPDRPSITKVTTYHAGAEKYHVYTFDQSTPYTVVYSKPFRCSVGAVPFEPDPGERVTANYSELIQDLEGLIQKYK